MKFAKLTPRETDLLRTVGEVAGKVYHCMKHSVLYNGEYAGTVNVKHKTLAGKIGCTDRTIRSAIAQLKACGLVEVVRDTGSGCFYFLSLDPESAKLSKGDPGLFLADRKSVRNLSSYPLGRIFPNSTDPSLLGLLDGSLGGNTAPLSDKEIRTLAARDRSLVTTHMAALREWRAAPEVPAPPVAAWRAHLDTCADCQAAEHPLATRRVFCVTGDPLVTAKYWSRFKAHQANCEECGAPKTVRVQFHCDEGAPLLSLASFSPATIRPPRPTDPELTAVGLRTLAEFRGYDGLLSLSSARLDFLRKDWQEEWALQYAADFAQVPGEQLGLYEKKAPERKRA